MQPGSLRFPLFQCSNDIQSEFNKHKGKKRVEENTFLIIHSKYGDLLRFRLCTGTEGKLSVVFQSMSQP